MAGTKLYKKRSSVKTLYFYGVYNNEAYMYNSLQIELISLFLQSSDHRMSQ